MNVTLKLDKAASDAAVIGYTVEGTTYDGDEDEEYQGQLPDFSIEESNIVIAKGATSVDIPVVVYEDREYEFEDLNDDFVPYEDLVITLTDVISGPVVLGENVSFTLNILEDDLLAVLAWDPQDQDGEDGGDVDMDLFVWLEEEVVDYSAAIGNEAEGVIIYGGFPNGTYSFSHNYYGGTSDQLEFYSFFFGRIDNQYYPYPDEPISKTGNYSLSNQNPYDQTQRAPEKVQTIVKNGLNFTSLSDINEVDGSSRVITAAPAKTLHLRNILNRAARSSREVKTRDLLK